MPRSPHFQARTITAQETETLVQVFPLPLLRHQPLVKRLLQTLVSLSTRKGIQASGFLPAVFLKNSTRGLPPPNSISMSRQSPNPFSIPKMLHKWDHTVRNLLGLAFLAQLNYLQIHPDCCVDEWFIPFVAE